MANESVSNSSNTNLGGNSQSERNARDFAEIDFSAIDDYLHTFDEMEKLAGTERFKTDWHKSDLAWCDADDLADVDASAYGIEGIQKLLAVDSYARVVGPDCAGKFQALDSDVLLSLHTAQQRLLEGIRQEMGRFRERHTPKSPAGN